MYEDFAVRGPFSALVAPLMRADRDDADGADLGGEPDGDLGGDSLDTDPTQSDADDASALEARDGAGDDRDDDDEDEEDEYARYKDLPVEEQLKKLRASNKRKTKKLRERTPDYERIQRLTRQGVSLDDLIFESRSYRGLSQKLQTNPKLRALLEGGGDDDGERRPSRGTTRRSGDDDEFTFDDRPEALGFDPNDLAQPANKVIAKFMRDAARANWRADRIEARFEAMGLDKLPKRLEGVERTVTQSTVREINKEWDGAASAALRHIKNEGHRDVFKDLMISYRKEFGGKEPASRVVAHILKKLGVNPAAATKAVAAARSTQHAATRVTQLQRQPTAHGTSAPARTGKENLRDVRRRLATSVSAGAAAR